MTVTLYQIAPSFYSQIARLTLTEKDVDWTERQVNIGPVMENYQPWFMRLHPKGVVPVLDHDGRIVIEALDIIQYIEATFDGPTLTPSEPEKRKQMNAWLQRFKAFPVRELSYGLLDAKAIGKLARHSYDLRRKTLKRHIRNNPDIAELYQARIDDIEAWQKISTNPAKVEQLEQELTAILKDLDKELAHGQPWLLGQQFTLADIWLAILLSRLEQLWLANKNDNPDRKLPGNVEAYFQRLRSRPAFKKADIWLGIRPSFMLRMIAPFLLQRLLAALAIIAGIGYAIWWLLTY